MKLRKKSKQQTLKSGDIVEVIDGVHDSAMPNSRRGLIVESVGKIKDQHIVMFSNGSFLKFHTIQLKLLVKH